MKGFESRQSLSFLHVDVGDAFHTIAEKRLYTTGRSGVGERFVFFTHRRRRGVSIYQSYYRREEKNTTGRSGVLVGRWRSNPQVVGSRLDSALSFSHVDVGEAFQFINHIIAERRKIQQVGVVYW